MQSSSVCFAVVFAGLAAVTPGASANFLSLDGIPQLSVDALVPGQRMVRVDGPGAPNTMMLGGRRVEFASADAMIGHSSDAIYVAVAGGEARLGQLRAGPGEAILIAPVGAPPSIVTFDAERMRAMFGPEPPPTLRGFVSKLDDAADDQAWGIFFGRYQRSVLDLQAPGGARTEAGRSSEIVRIRYSGHSDPDQIEAMVVARAAQALASRDALALAQLLDPAPYGGDDLGGGGDEARLLVAQQLIVSHARAASGEVRRGAGEGVWRAGAVTLRTRPFSDFVFISAIE
jgi:hypothetical protein